MALLNLYFFDFYFSFLDRYYVSLSRSYSVEQVVLELKVIHTFGDENSQRSVYPSIPVKVCPATQRSKKSQSTSAPWSFTGQTTSGSQVWGIFLFFTLKHLAFSLWQTGDAEKRWPSAHEYSEGLQKQWNMGSRGSGIAQLWPYKWVTSHKYTSRTWLWEGRQSTRAITFSRCDGYKWEGEQEGKDAQWQWPTMSWLAHWQRKVPSRGQMGNLVRRGWSLSWFGAYPGTSSCRRGLPWTHRDDAASVSWVLALKVCATPARQQTLSKTSLMLFFEMFSHENECSIYVCRIWNSRNL